ncbi:titin homolog [Parasteatoda tepidariorum]|uniref:titin homolog n=1 Tax=Parasteatoda tepidariorum TaxID=114398 RepID=UPI00077FAF8D|nr:uncharacterized protein LOC107451977 [Parasteatoda tepidariorum]XP_042907041.1 uncharacterized protein LOC107451977 [Parasteatoda tepidariorum]
MDQSPDTTPQKTSPFIIKLSCASSSKEPDASSSEPAIDSATSLATKPIAVKMKPVALTLCRLSKDGILTKSPEPLKISPALSLKLGAALRERIPLKSLPSQKETVDTKLDNLNEAGVQRQSLTSHSSKLSDNRLDFVQGGDKSQVWQLTQPPLTMQPSNLHTDDLLDAKYGGGGLETTVVQGSSTTLSPVASGNVTSAKCTKKQISEIETEIEPARKKIKLCDTAEVVSETQPLSPMDITIADINTKKSKIIEFRNPPSEQICIESSICMLDKEKSASIVAQPQICPSTSLPSSVEKTNLSVKSEQTKIILDKKPFAVTTDHHLVIACSSDTSNLGSKDESVENFKTSSPLKSRDSDANQQLLNPQTFTPKVIKIDESDDKSKLKKPVSLLDVDQENKVEALESRVNLESIKSFSPTLTNFALNSEPITNLRDEEIKVNDTFISQMKACEIDQNLKPNLKSTCTFDQSSQKNASFSSNDLKAISLDSNHDDLVKNNSSKIEDKNMSIDTKDQDKKSGSSCKEVKVCPFKLNFEGKLNVEINKSKKVKFKNEAVKKDFVPLHLSKDDFNSEARNETDQNSKESLVYYDDESLKSNNNCEMDSQSKVLLEKSSKSNSQSESVVNNNFEIKDKKLDSKEQKLEGQDEDYSGDEGNELLGISSDESNQMESQNGYKEPEIEFDILDEFESNDNDPDQEARSSDSESEISANEIDAMLEAGLGDYGKPSPENQHEVKEKLILKVRGKDHFEVLPEGWIEVTHNSGIPIYLHKQTRVCCVSKPYFLGPGSTRKHEIPISAIPCLQYQKELEKEKLEAEGKLKGIEENLENKDSSTNNTDCKKSTEANGMDRTDKTENHATQNGCADTNMVDTSAIKSGGMMKNVSNVAKGSNLIFPSAKLESVKEVKVSGSLDYLAVREYCQKRFEFQTITVKRFKTWFGRRKHQKQIKRKQRPFLPDNTQLITCPLPANTDKSTTIGSTSKREFIMNPTGKSPVCILHEYVQHTLRVQPKYIFKELESASTPYGAVVIINEMEYGTGYGSSKKVAKSEAARSALEVLIPKIKKFDPEKRSGDEDDFQDVEFFDQVRVEDPRISDLSVKAGQPFPYQILLECLKRNYGMGDTEISIRMKNLKHQKNEFIMKVGKHKATVVCKNKRDGKHRASQAILQQLHPHIISWGSLLRMYGKGSCKTLKEKKEEEQRITELQSKACVNKPNVSILNKLKEEMMKYREKMKSKKPIGKLIPERMQLFSISDSNLKSIEL